MDRETKRLDQQLDFLVPDWKVPDRPKRSTMEGRYCRLEPLDPQRHASHLYVANAEDSQDRNWTYLPYGPFASLESYRAWMEKDCTGEDPLFFAIVDQSSNRGVGVSSYLRIDPNSGSIEVGHINYSPLLQHTTGATEAMYLMMKNVFELGYRRYEWKCNALNAPSRIAAERLGFSFEGIFRQAAVVKGRNRDTAWYSVIDREWPALREVFLKWLEPSNFDSKGQQLVSLTTMKSSVTSF
jgi:RimJ/RimL family protein N-acetyltransferase